MYSPLTYLVVGILRFNMLGDKTERVVTTQPLIISQCALGQFIRNTTKSAVWNLGPKTAIQSDISLQQSLSFLLPVCIRRAHQKNEETCNLIPERNVYWKAVSRNYCRSVLGYFSGRVVRNPEALLPGNGTATRCSVWQNTFCSYTTNHKATCICIVVIRNFGKVFISVSLLSYPLSN